jgi:hypothetical protein
VNQIVAATLNAIPTAPPAPTLVPYPTPTPFNPAGIFCEYKFCIGHPADVAFFDNSAQKNPLEPSAYGQGIITAYNGSAYIIMLIWQHTPGATDPQFLLDLMIDPNADTRTGSPELKLVRGMNVVYIPLTSTATLLTYGGAGAWICGERVFAWKAYSAQSDLASTLFEEAMAKFTCGEN